MRSAQVWLAGLVCTAMPLAASAAVVSLVQNFDVSPAVGTDHVVSMSVTDDSNSPASGQLVGGQTGGRVFGPGGNEDGAYLSMGDFSAGPVGPRYGTLTYQFDAASGEQFSGPFRIDIRDAVLGSESANSWGSVTLSVKTNQDLFYTQLHQLTSSTGYDSPPTAGASFDDFVSFDATGSTTVSVQVVLARRFFPEFAQLARLEFTGNTVAVPEPASVTALLGLSGLLAARRIRN